MNSDLSSENDSNLSLERDLGSRSEMIWSAIFVIALVVVIGWGAIETGLWFANMIAAANN